MTVFWVDAPSPFGSGSDSNDGLSEGAPKATWAAGFTLLAAGSAGDELRIIKRDGHTYRPTGTATFYITTSGDGASGNRKRVRGWYKGGPAVGWYDKPVLNGYDYVGSGSSSRAISFKASHWNFEDLKFINWNEPYLGSSQTVCDSYNVSTTITDIDWLRCIWMWNSASSIGVSGENGICNNIRIAYCDSFYNSNVNDFENTDGFNLYGYQTGPGCSGTGNMLEYCRMAYNADDGFDCFEWPDPITIRYNWAWKMGFLPDGSVSTTPGDGNGIKLGGAIAVAHDTIGNMSVENAAGGFDNNANAGAIEYYNNTAHNCGGTEFLLNNSGGSGAIVRNNLLFTGTQSTPPGATVDNNSWNDATVTAADFLATTLVGLDAERETNGDLPIAQYLRLTAGSDCIDAGTTGGLIPFNDLGCFEYLAAAAYVQTDYQFLADNGSGGLGPPP